MKKLKKLLEKFLATTENILTQMRISEKEKDYEELSLQAHKLKGASSSLCLDEITNIVVEMENALKQESVYNYANAVDELQALLDEIKQYNNEKLSKAK